MRAIEFLIENDDDDHRSQLNKTGFWGRAAAGSIVYSRSTGRFCLAHRSPNVLEPNTWGMWGGAMDSGESPEDTARRELIEETRYRGNAEFHPLWTFEHSSGFRYYNFLAIVDREFVPHMDWETQGYDWFDLSDRDSWPSPLHPGVATLLSRSDVMSRLLSLKPNQQGVAEEVNPQIFLPIFRQQEKIVTDKAGREYKLVAKPGPRELGQKFNSPSRLFTIEAYLLDRAVRVAWVNFVNHGEHLEAEDVVVEPKYRRRGLASAMYNFAKELGNDVKPSDKQTALGREFAAGYQYDKAKGMAEGAIKDLDIDLLDQQWDAIVGYVINGLEKNMDIGRIELNLYKYAGREMFDVDQALEDHGFESIADLADHIQQNNGRYVPPTFNLGEQDLTESLRIDVPNENWLQGKIDYAKKKGRNRFGAPDFNATTAYFTDDVRVPIQVLRKLPGMRGEQQNVRQNDLAAIKKILKDTGKLPLGRDGKEYAPFVLVAYNGEAWVSEGNHRIMAAAELYDEGDMRFASLPVELKYFDGGERVESGPLHPGKISQSMSENFVNKVIQESFDQPYPIIWSRGEHGDVDGFTTLADGSRLELLFNLENKESKQWMFQFYRDDRDDVSGQGDAQRVFATVLSALKIFLRRRRPNMLHFSASREVDSGQKPQSRSNLYTRLMQRYAPTWGYNVEIYDDGGRRVEYVLTPKVKQKTNENFADGRKPGRKGLAKRMGVNCKQPVSKLRKIAKNSSGERQRMAHWCANMKAGRKK